MSEINEGKHRATYLISFREWMAECGVGALAEREKLVRTTSLSMSLKDAAHRRRKDLYNGYTFF